MTQIDCFSAQKKELLEGCTVLSAFRTADGEIFIECEKRVAFVARRVADSLEKCGEFTPLLIAAAVAFYKVSPILFIVAAMIVGNLAYGRKK